MFNKFNIKKCGSANDEDFQPQSGGEGFKSSFLQLMIPRPFNLGWVA